MEVRSGRRRNDVCLPLVLLFRNTILAEILASSRFSPQNNIQHVFTEHLLGAKHVWPPGVQVRVWELGN